jgi:hypothetical protein
MRDNKHGNRAQGGYDPNCMLPRPHGHHWNSRPWDQPAVECFGEPKSAPATQSGYTHCACRDCMDTTVSSDTTKPELCEACREADCVAIAPYNEGIQYCSAYECQRDDAYGNDPGCIADDPDDCDGTCKN